MRDTRPLRAAVRPARRVAHRLFVRARPRADLRLPDGELALHALGAVIADRAEVGVLARLERRPSAAARRLAGYRSRLASTSVALDLDRVRELRRVVELDRAPSPASAVSVGLGERLRAAGVGRDLSASTPVAARGGAPRRRLRRARAWRRARRRRRSREASKRGARPRVTAIRLMDRDTRRAPPVQDQLRAEDVVGPGSCRSREVRRGGRSRIDCRTGRA